MLHASDIYFDFKLITTDVGFLVKLKKSLTQLSYIPFSSLEDDEHQKIKGGALVNTTVVHRCY